MNIKSLLLGSAVAAVAATGARAADAIVIAEPEPMEYVRICDVYGAGFFYIPGTQNCLKIGGYVRYQMTYDSNNHHQGPVGGPYTNHSYRFTKLARFAPTFDVRSETEWGTLRAFAEVEFDWVSASWQAGAVAGRFNAAGAPATTARGWTIGAGSGFQSTNLNHAYIELIQSMGTFRIGKGDNPWARFTSYGAGGIYAGAYAHGNGGFRNSGEVSYTFNSGSGLEAVLAFVEPGTGLFQPNIEGGVKFSQGWGSIAGMVGYDNPANAWGAKGVLRVNFAPFSAGLHVFYSSTTGANVYGTPNPNGGTSRWSVLGHARVAASDKLDVKGHFQWYGASAVGAATWEAGGGLVVKPFSNNSLEILPEVRYVNRAGVQTAGGTNNAGSYWNMALRFNRNF